MKTFRDYLQESKVVKSVKVGDFDHQLHNHGYGYQVRVYNKGHLHHTDMTKNTLEKGMESLDINVQHTRKQLRLENEE